MPVENIFLGIEIGGTKLQIVEGTASGDIVHAHRFQVDRDRGAEGIRALIEETVCRHYVGKVAATGIGFGGPVNWQTGTIATSFHIEGWADCNLVSWLEPIVGSPVFIDNDANVAALGEAFLGAGKGHSLVLYITVGSGVGGGLIVDEKIYHGAIPGEVEIGHLRMNKSGDTFQDLCSGWGIDARIRKLTANSPSGIFATLIGSRTTGEAAFLKAAMEQNDQEACGLFEEIVDDLAYGLSHAIHLLHPNVVILGGGFSLIGEILQVKLTKHIRQYLMKAFHPAPTIRLAELKENAVPVGALLLASQKLKTFKNV